MILPITHRFIIKIKIITYTEIHGNRKTGYKFDNSEVYIYVCGRMTTTIKCLKQPKIEKMLTGDNFIVEMHKKKVAYHTST